MHAEVTLRSRVSPALVLGGIFAVALFVRAFFAYELALRDFLVSGGSDAFYFRWILENITTTGRHLFEDRMLNYPLAMVNPRPPIYAWSVALVGLLVGALQGSVASGVGQTFLFSTAVWGALTIFPTYFLAKEMFGQRTAYVAAFFLAILPAHIARTPLSNGDHDALVLFFVVTAFYFFLKALEELKERSWIEAWWRPRSVFRGLRALVTENRNTILLSVMAGTALAVIALTWKGWAYAVVIIIVYFLAQLLVHKVRNQDPLGILLAFTITLGVAHLLAAPYYVVTNQVRTWFDIPLFLFVASVGLGLIFSFFHRLPWMLVIPPVLLGFAAGTAIAAFYSPTVASALASGLGYFVPTKVFETIAEAQPPNLSQVILSFGAVTFYLSLAGIALLVIQFLRRPRPDFLFVLVWSTAAVFMALSAVRFIFNASPAFAITSAWIVILIVERLGLEQVGKAVATTGGSRLGALRKGVKIRHIAGVLLIAFLLVLPNTWFAVDAGSPFEVKEDLEEQVLRVTPDFLRPPGAGQGLFYFGAFGFSLPLPTRYFPAAWSWFAEQDADVVPLSERPAFLSWWDYGFESIAEGRHPTVADNFQNGLEFAGHFLTSQGENEGIAVLNVRLLLGDVVANGGQFSPAAALALRARGLDPDHVLDALSRPTLFVPLIRAEPERFGEWDTRLSAENARIIYLRTVLTEELDLDTQAELYRDLQLATGFSVGYFAVDTRLIPFSGTNTGIFYAVVKLTDHRTKELPDGRSIPVDFYRLVAVTPQGEFDLDQVPPAAQIQDVRIEFKDAWYNSMLYRIFFGPDGKSLGLENDGLPAISGTLQSVEPRHAWMLRHFNMVYRTAYFNPHPPEEAANFSEDFTALNLFEALELQRQIDEGEIEGVVDTSAGVALRNGIVIVRFYDGAILRGQVTTEGGNPLAGIRVTTLDSLFTPHDVRFTDARGRYEVLLPFGEARVAVSSGPADNTTGTGTILVERSYNISLAQALRVPLDEEGTGLPGFVVEDSFAVPGAVFRGTAFIDANRDAQRDPEDRALEGLEVLVQDIVGNAPGATKVTGPGGDFEVSDLLPSRYRLSLRRLGAEVTGLNETLGTGEERMLDLVVPGAGLSGLLTDEFGQPVAGAVVTATEEATGVATSTVAGGDGSYDILGLFGGTYRVEAEAAGRGALPRRVALVAGEDTSLDIRVEPLGELTGRSLVSFVPTPHVTLSLARRGGEGQATITTDPTGRFVASLPRGLYDVYALHFAQGIPHGFLGTVAIGPGTQSLELNLRPAYRVAGTVTSEDGAGVADATVTFERSGALLPLASEADGAFSTFLTAGQYRVWALSLTGQHVGGVTIQGPASLTLPLSAAVATEGRLFRDLNGNGTYDPGEGLPGVRVQVERSSGSAFSVFTASEGAFTVPLLADTDYVWSIEEGGFAPVRIGPLSADAFVTLGPIEMRADSVPVTGLLTSADSLELEGLDIAFEAVGDGAVSRNVTTGAQGAFTALLEPGTYRLVVDAEVPASNGSLRIQGLEEGELRVPVGGSVQTLALPVVERVRVEGTLDAGGGLLPVVVFDGPDRVTVEGEGPYLRHLQRGDYTVYGVTEDPVPKALLAFLTVTDPDSFSPSFEPAALLTGTLRVDGSPVIADVSLALTRDDGARVEVANDGSGGYEATLVPGNYTATAEWVGADRLDGPARFVRYTLDEAFILTASRELDLTFGRELDLRQVAVQVILGTQPAAGALTFRAANETAITSRADVPGSGMATVALAPGLYDLYAHRPIGNSVSLSRIQVLPEGSNAVEVRLEQGVRVFGVATLSDGSRRLTRLQFATPAAAANFTTDAQGNYEVYLPSRQYELLASAERGEKGVMVEYRFSSSVDLVDSTLVNPLLGRVDVRRLAATWDATQRTHIAPGETAVYTVAVTNTGNREDTYTFEGAPADWTFSFRPSRLTLPFGAGNQAEVTVRITAPEDALVAHDPVSVVARSTSDPSVTSSAPVVVDILQFRGLALRPSSTAPILNPESLRYMIDVVNEGNGPDTFTLVLANPEALVAQGWKVELVYRDLTSSDRVEGISVAARASETVTLRLEPLGQVSATTATFVAFSQEDSQVGFTMELAVDFPRLTIPPDQLQLEGKNVRLGPPEFPVLLYGALAAAAIGLTVLFLTYSRRRRRR